MKINSFEDLTSFVANEYSKMTEIYGLKQPSPVFYEFIENTLMKYSKLYDKPLERKLKRQIALMEAIDTMPHGWLWKLCHPDLWARIKLMPEFNSKLKDQDCNKSVEESITPEVLTPIVVNKTTLPEIHD